MEVAGHQLMERRAVALATVLLTRHPDLLVAEVRHDMGYDLEVSILRNGQISGRIFGVELKARMTVDRIGRLIEPNRLRLQAPLRDALRSFGMRVREVPFPILFLVFAMDTDRAFFGWLREPVVEPSPRLASKPAEFATEWQPSTHETVVGAVQRWYDCKT